MNSLLCEMFIKLIYTYKSLVNAIQFRLLLLYQLTGLKIEPRLMEPQTISVCGEWIVRNLIIGGRREPSEIQRPTFNNFPRSKDRVRRIALLHLHATSATNFQIE